VGSCTVFSGGFNVTAVLQGQPPATATANPLLNAGSPLTVTGAGGSRNIPRDNSTGTYFALLGGSIPVPGFPSNPLFLDPGAYTISGPGGADVGSFTANLTISAGATWTNRDQLSVVDRGAGVTLTWTGGDPARQVITILGSNVDVPTNASGTFICFAPVSAGTFTVPREITSALPGSNLDQPDQSQGILAFLVGSSGDLSTFTAPGLDAGVASFTSLSATTAVYR